MSYEVDWHPIRSEADLPEPHNAYLVTYEPEPGAQAGEVWVDTLFPEEPRAQYPRPGFWTRGTALRLRVIAWAEMPAPYVPEEGEP
jgi:hypothetical protein